MELECPDGWKLVSLRELGEVNRGRSRHRPRYAEHLYGGLYPFIQTGDVKSSNGRVTSHTQSYSEAGLAQSRLWPAGTMCITIAANIAETGILTFPACFPDSVVGFIAEPKKADVQFVEYMFRFMRSRIQHQATGSVQDNINIETLERLHFPIPPLAEQKAIASVLGALDDKIELNRRMNATLEAMARALFQSWFVDFDPVRAKLDGRQPFGLDPGTAALFPEHFQDSEAGHIPEDWTVSRVRDLATLNRAAVNPGDFPTEPFDHYSLPAFDNGRSPKVELGSAIMSNKFVVSRDSVLLSKLNPHIPRIWLPDLHVTRRSVCSTEFMVASTRPGYSREFLFSLFTSGAFASTYGTLVTGTTGSHQRIRPESVLDMKIVIPPSPLVDAFAALAKPMFDQINRNIDQSRTLAILRDTLLPKLLRGEMSSALAVDLA
jgi:type I restriction enzyme, S subunit